MEANYLKCSSIQTVQSIELKFCICIIGHHYTYCVDFGEFDSNSFYAGVQKHWYTL